MRKKQDPVLKEIGNFPLVLSSPLWKQQSHPGDVGAWQDVPFCEGHFPQGSDSQNQVEVSSEAWGGSGAWGGSESSTLTKPRAPRSPFYSGGSQLLIDVRWMGLRFPGSRVAGLCSPSSKACGGSRSCPSSPSSQGARVASPTCISALLCAASWRIASLSSPGNCVESFPPAPPHLAGSGLLHSPTPSPQWASLSPHPPFWN